MHASPGHACCVAQDSRYRLGNQGEAYDLARDMQVRDKRLTTRRILYLIADHLRRPIPYLVLGFWDKNTRTMPLFS